MPKRTVRRITQEFVDGLRADPKKESWYADDRFSGFGIRTRPNGSITYELRWRDGTRQKRHRICRTAEKPLAEVLQHVRADLIPNKIRNNADFAHTRRVADAREAALCDVYMDLMDELQAKQRSNGYINETARLWFQHLRTSLGDVRVQDLTRAELEDYVQGLSDNPSEANQVRALIARLCKLAVTLGYRDDNPAIALPRCANAVDRNVVTPAHRALIREQGHAFASPEAYERIVFMIETGLRPSVLTRMTWDEVDLENGVWTKKTRRASGQAQDGVRLGKTATELLARRKEEGHEAPFKAYSTRRAWARLQKELDLPTTLKPYKTSAHATVLSIEA